MALTILTAGLAACGLLLLLWSVAEAMLLPLPREDAVLVAPPGRRQNIWSGWGPLRPEPGRPGRMGELALGAGAGQRDDRRCGL